MTPGTCYGRSDVALIDGWQATMPALAERLRSTGARRVLSSPSSRCSLPAEMLAHALAIPVDLEPALLELDFGDWEGIAWDDVPRDALDVWAADPLGFAPPGGESGQALIARVGVVHRRLAAAAVPWLVVSHGGPLRVLAQMLRGGPVDLLHPAPAMGELVEGQGFALDPFKAPL